jgi:hypothetical protein
LHSSKVYDTGLALSCKDGVLGFSGGENLDGNPLGYDTTYSCR